jgi:PEP-CTERM motif
MKMRKWCAAALVAAAALATNAHAALVAGSSLSGGTVVDTSTGAEWLRLDVSAGQSVAQALTNYGGDGFRWATQAELNGLLDEFFGIYGGDPGTRAGGLVFGAGTTVAAEAAWNQLFGLSYVNGSFRESLGFYDDGVAGTPDAWFGFNSTPATFNAESNPPVFDIAIFLVRGNSVPEPGTLLLVAAAGIAFIGTGRRAKRRLPNPSKR